MRRNDERFYLPTPMYHALGLAMTAMALRLGSELVIAPRFSASRYWDDVREHGCTFAYHVGTIAQMLYKQPPKPTDGEHQLRVFMGGGMPAEIWEDFARRFKVKVIESYSASDGVGAITNDGDGPVGSFGRATPELEVRVVDRDDNEVPAGDVGELQLRPALGGVGGPAVEYFGDADATEDKNRGGWVRTGDLVRQDEAGWLFFVDRMKDVIRRRGVNIAPAEIERIVAQHERVRECAALAVPADLGEDEIKLVVVADGLDVDDIGRFVDEQLPGHMRPRYIELVAALPKSITERVQRYQLKDQWRTPTTWDRAISAPVPRGPGRG
jgi:crotonobetaine/carnitine-CoA ligase